MEPSSSSTTLLAGFYPGTPLLHPWGHGTGVRGGVQTVWLPVARSQKARFASRKRIKAFQRARARRIQPPGRSYETAFDLHSCRVRRAYARDRSRSRRLAMTIATDSLVILVNGEMGDREAKARGRAYLFIGELTWHALASCQWLVTCC